MSTILERYRDDARRMDVHIQGTTTLLLNKHGHLTGHSHASRDLKHYIYRIPGTHGKHGIPLERIEDVMRQHITTEGYQRWQFDRGIELAGERSYARIVGPAVLTHRRNRVSMAGYSPWSLSFSIFFVRSLFDPGRLGHVLEAVGRAGIGDDVTGCYGRFEVLEIRVYLNDSVTYRQYKANPW